MRIQVEFDDAAIQTIEKLKQQTGLATYKELFNNALALFSWGANERVKGRLVVSFDEKRGEYRELHMPSLEHAAQATEVVDKGAA